MSLRPPRTDATSVRSRAVTRLLPALAIALLACAPDHVMDSAAEDSARAGGDGDPTVVIHYPIADPQHGAFVACDSIEVHWAGTVGGSGAKIAGYQIKLIDIPNSLLPLVQAVSLLTSTECRRDNLVIPPERVVDEGVPLTDSTYHACDWYPKESSLLSDRSFMLEDIPYGALVAIRAFDVDGHVTPPEAYRFSVEGEDGNLLIFGTAVRRWVVPWVLSVREPSFPFEASVLVEPDSLEVPAGYPLEIRWKGLRAPCGPMPAIEYAYALDIPDPDCASCTDPDGVGGWSPWSHKTLELPHPLVFGERDVGTVHTLHVKMRDPGYTWGPDPRGRLDIHTFSGGFERPALWVDDFIGGAFDDCAHDALIGRWLDGAVRPHVRAQEGIARWDVHPPGDDPCNELETIDAPTFDDLSRFRMAFWHVAHGELGSALGEVTVPWQGRALADYVRAGGGLVVWGRGTIGALLGDEYPQDQPHLPALPMYQNSSFGPGSFLWDIVQLRTAFDRVGRGTPRRLKRACSGLVGLEATPTAVAEGYPVGVLDPSGYSTDPANTEVIPRTAIWFDGWEGRRNPFGGDGEAATGPQALDVAGMDTLYTIVSNGWSYLEDGANAVRDACGTALGSPFEARPVVIRYDHPRGGRFVWIGTELTQFDDRHAKDIRRLMEKLIAWVLEDPS